MNERIKILMEKLNCSEAEAKQIIADDAKIDKGEKMFDLSAEQEKIAKKYRQADRKPTVYEFTKRERKADTDKSTLITLIKNAIEADCDSLSVVNAEREIEIFYNGRKFKIVLSAPRK